MLSYLYQELVGGAIFLIGLWLVWRGGELGRTRRGWRLLAGLVGGLLLLALLQGVIQWAAVS